MQPKNKKLSEPLPLGMQKRMLEETYDLDREAERQLDELESAVKSGRCSMGFALARAFGNGASYVQKSLLLKVKREKLDTVEPGAARLMRR
jgi:hypothetical protein